VLYLSTYILLYFPLLSCHFSHKLALCIAVQNRRKVTPISQSQWAHITDIQRQTEKQSIADGVVVRNPRDAAIHPMTLRLLLRPSGSSGIPEGLMF